MVKYNQTLKRQLRSFCFTINNYTGEDDFKLLSTFPKTKYLIVGQEVGASGTPHYQCYCELSTAVSFGKIKKLLPTAHIEARKGTSFQASNYCRKEGKVIYEEGELSQQGKRNDLTALQVACMEGVTDKELYLNHPAMFRFYRHAGNCKRVFHKARFDTVQPLEFVEVHFGAPGTGKSKQAYDRYHKEGLYVLRDSKEQWFDGYEGESTLLIEEMEGLMPYNYLLGLLDVYPMRLPVKGSFCHKGWKRVIITSNLHPSDWYGPDKWALGALERRITSMHPYKESNLVS